MLAVALVEVAVVLDQLQWRSRCFGVAAITVLD